LAPVFGFQFSVLGFQFSVFSGSGLTVIGVGQLKNTNHKPQTTNGNREPKTENQEQTSQISD
jgi:hypothetical protein